MENDFAYILETKGVTERIRGAFGHRGVRRTAIFARLTVNGEKFRDMLVKRMGLDEAASMEDAVQVALLVDVWETARSGKDFETLRCGGAHPLPECDQPAVTK